MGSSMRRTNNTTPQMVGLREDASMEDMKRRVSQVFESHFGSRNGVHVVSWDAEFPQLDRGM